jgi:hypothetical protein
VSLLVVTVKHIRDPLSSKRSLSLQVLHLCSPLLRAERASLWPREHHMMLTFRAATSTFFFSNVSKQPQTVWEDWNSWGYQAISFELNTADAKKHVVSKRQQEFTINFPSTVVIEPGEHQVYVIHFDEWWEIHPLIPKTDEMSITLKAIYEVSPTSESTQYKVWTGRLESHDYKFLLRQW